MKHTYLAPKMELLILANGDVISTSLQSGETINHENMAGVDFGGLTFN